MLLLLYAQPLVKVVTFPTSIVDDGETGMSIALGAHPTEVPEPFASRIREHLASRPNLMLMQTVGTWVDRWPPVSMRCVSEEGHAP